MKKKRSSAESGGSSGRHDYKKAESLCWAFQKIQAVDRGLILLLAGSVPVTVVTPLVRSYFSKVLIDRIGLGATFAELAVVCAVFGVMIFLVYWLQEFFQNKINGHKYYATGLFQLEMNRMSNYETDFENTEKQDYREIHGYAWGDACGGNCALEFTWADVANALASLLGTITYASLLLALNPLLCLIVVATSLTSYYTVRMQPSYYEKHKHEWEKETRKKSYLENLSENFNMAKDIRLYGLGDWINRMLQDYQTYILMWNKKCSLRGVWAQVISGLMALIQNGAAYFMLIGILLSGGMSVGDFVFYFGIMGNIADFLGGICSSVAVINTRIDKIHYYRALYDYPNRFNHEEGCALPAMGGLPKEAARTEYPADKRGYSVPARSQSTIGNRCAMGGLLIEFRDVWYRYSGADDYTLKGVNLTFQPGESIALVGVNGVGKTTLVKLLCGLYAPTKGEILVAGRPISEYNIMEYYSMISAVFQNSKAIALTIFEFVTSAFSLSETEGHPGIEEQRVNDGDLSTSKKTNQGILSASDSGSGRAAAIRSELEQEAVRALQQAGLWEKVASLPNGIHTHLMKGIYDDGVDFSGGEMQKLFLARAICKDGPILVLDEPTAALDPIAENQIYLQYHAMTAGKTSLYISHRFASTRFCDRVVLLENGVITESGSHEELMRQNGQYAHMFHVQSQYYEEAKEKTGYV